MNEIFCDVPTINSGCVLGWLNIIVLPPYKTHISLKHRKIIILCDSNNEING